MKSQVKAILLLVCMLIAAVAAYGVRPTLRLADVSPPIDLESMIPKSFGDWREEPQSISQVVDPEQQQTISKFYGKTLMRTYTNSKGYRVMLSVAYGADQRDAMQLHLPEVCYPAQGFAVEDSHSARLLLPPENSSGSARSLPIIRVVAKKGQRQEPITYFTTIGKSVVESGLDRKMHQIKYGLSGVIPDGMLIRFSSIDKNLANGFVMQERFAIDLIKGASVELQTKMGILSIK